VETMAGAAVVEELELTFRVWWRGERVGLGRRVWSSLRRFFDLTEV